MDAKPHRRLPTLRTLTYALVVLLLVLAGMAVLYVVGMILAKFAQVILLFFVGALVAYLLSPAVSRLQDLVRKRWAAILIMYLLAALTVLVLGVLLFAPFVQQSQSLVDNLHNPSKATLQPIASVRDEASSLHQLLAKQSQDVSNGANLSEKTISRTKTRIAQLEAGTAALPAKGAKGPGSVNGKKVSPAPAPRTRVPPLYVTPLSKDVARLAASYSTATASRTNPNVDALNKSVSYASSASADARGLYKKVSSSPLMVLNAQSWLDDHGINIDLHDKFGQAVQEITNRSASILNNAVGILLNAGTLLVDSFLILIISVYFLSDGARLVRKCVSMAPGRYGGEAVFFVRSLDKVMGGYIRGQLLLALVSGILGGGGAAVLGVPYPVLIGMSTFLLSLVPVIGPVVLIIPPVVISLIFMPITTTIILLVYFLVFMQIVTNVVGPRVMGGAVGIHPLEAMAAALVGFPIAGLLGSFLAVPTVGFLHIAVREAVRYYRSDQPRASDSVSPPARESSERVATPT